MSDAILYCEKCRYHFGLLKDQKLPTSMSHQELGGLCPGRLIAHTPVYAAVFLTEDSKRRLLEKVPPKHPNVYAEHMTLGFGRHLKEKYPLGEVIEILATTIHEDERGQCVGVWPGDAAPLFWESQQPHITVSCAEGVKPFYSNELIANYKPNETSRLTNIILHGVVDYHPRTKT